MRRRSRIEPRQIIFIGVEGPSERAFVQFLARCGDDAELRLHLEAKPATGGDTLAIVEEANRRLERHPTRKEIKTRLVLLDRDRLEQDLRAGRDARAFASKRKIEIVFQEPNLEGLLLRLHPGQEQRRVTPQDAERELRKLWPEYRKPPTAARLKQRFSVSDLRRAARHDRELQRLLNVVGLGAARSDEAR